MRKVSVTESRKDETATYGLEISTEIGTLLIFKNISSDRASIEELAKRLENTDIAIEHIKDIVGDFIIGETCDRLIANEIAF